MGDPSKANDLLALLHDHEVPEVLIAKVHTLGLIQTKLFPGVFSEERHFVDRLMAGTEYEKPAEDTEDELVASVRCSSASPLENASWRTLLSGVGTTDPPSRSQFWDESSPLGTALSSHLGETPSAAAHSRLGRHRLPTLACAALGWRTRWQNLRVSPRAERF